MLRQRRREFKVCMLLSNLIHIMCGYQCDKAVTKNDTREVK